MPTPGAQTSGFAVKSIAVGPRRAEARNRVVGGVEVPFVLNAQTVITQGALPGEVMPPHCSLPVGVRAEVAGRGHDDDARCRRAPWRERQRVGPVGLSTRPRQPTCSRRGCCWRRSSSSTQSSAAMMSPIEPLPSWSSTLSDTMEAPGAMPASFASRRARAADDAGDVRAVAVQVRCATVLELMKSTNLTRLLLTSGVRHAREAGVDERHADAGAGVPVLLGEDVGLHGGVRQHVERLGRVVVVRAVNADFFFKSRQERNRQPVDLVAVDDREVAAHERPVEKRQILTRIAASR